MARKGENIYKRKDGRWEGRYIKSRHLDGKPKYGYVYGYKFKEVKDKLLQLKSYYLNQNVSYVCYTGTFRDWTVSWMKETVCSKIKPSTYANYHGMLEKYILPALGNKKLSAITQPEIQQFIHTLEHKGLGANTIRNIYGMLNRVMKAAVKKQILLANPCLEVELPNKEYIHMEVLSLQDQEKLEAAALLDKDGIAVMLALYTGMRIGEISALRWNDVDLESGLLYVKRTAQRIPNLENSGRKTKIVVGEPKSFFGKRTIPLSERLWALLKTEKENACGEYVISNRGQMAEPRTIRFRYKRILSKAGISHLRFHGLRHTFSTRCMEQNMDVAVLSRILGHSSIKMTLDVYVDSTLEHRMSAIQKLDTLFKPVSIKVV